MLLFYEYKTKSNLTFNIKISRIRILYFLISIDIIDKNIILCMCEFHTFFKFDIINMEDLEKWFNNEPESVEDWLKGKVSDEAYKALDIESSVKQMIWSVENERMRYILEYNWKERICTSEEINNEIAIFRDKIAPTLRNEELNHLFDRLTMKGRLLPSRILKEFQIRDEILAESDPDVKEIMKISLKKIFPSAILNDRAIYQKIAKMENPDEKGIILHYFDYWFSPKWVDEQYEDFVYIKEYDNEGVRDLALAFIYGWNMPSLAMLHLDLFHEIVGYWEDVKNYILWLIKEWHNYSVEALLAKAHYYKKQD